MTNLSNNSNINKNNKSLKSIIANIRNLFFQKYYINEFEYGRKVINDIIFNEPSHIVALFKDFLIPLSFELSFPQIEDKFEIIGINSEYCFSHNLIIFGGFSLKNIGSGFGSGLGSLALINLFFIVSCL